MQSESDVERWGGVEASAPIPSSDDEEVPQDVEEAVEDVVYLRTSHAPLRRTESVYPLQGAKLIDLADNSDEPKVSLRGQPRMTPTPFPTPSEAEERSTGRPQAVARSTYPDKRWFVDGVTPTLEWCFDNVLGVADMHDRLAMMSAYGSVIRTTLRAQGLMPRIKRAKRNLRLEEDDDQE